MATLRLSVLDRAVFTVTSMLVLCLTLLIIPVLLDRSEPEFCALGLSGTTINGEFVALEDQHAPGRVDETCGDGTPNGIGGMDTLGFDCKIRNKDGRVVATTTPNRRDRTCGQPDTTIPIP